MLHRVEMNVMDMPPQILIGHNQMLPKTPLPNCSFTSMALVLIISRGFEFSKPSSELALDQTPTNGIVCVSRGKTPDKMYMIWHYGPRNKVERMPYFDILKAGEKKQIGIFIFEYRGACIGDYRKEVRAAWSPYPSIAHVCNYIYESFSRYE
jgi:hypothetical protein